MNFILALFLPRLALIAGIIIGDEVLLKRTLFHVSGRNAILGVILLILRESLCQCTFNVHLKVRNQLQESLQIERACKSHYHHGALCFLHSFKFVCGVFTFLSRGPRHPILSSEQILPNQSEVLLEL